MRAVRAATRSAVIACQNQDDLYDSGSWLVDNGSSLTKVLRAFGCELNVQQVSHSSKLLSTFSEVAAHNLQMS